MSTGATPMDADMVDALTKGKGKGKDKGVTTGKVRGEEGQEAPEMPSKKFDGECRIPKTYGHKASDCWWKIVPRGVGRKKSYGNDKDKQGYESAPGNAWALQAPAERGSHRRVVRAA